MIIQKPILKHPTNCSIEEIKSFKELVELNEQVNAQRVPEAKLLAFLHNEHGQLIAVGAIKNPTLQYREKVFLTKAGVTHESENWPMFEIGFFSILPDFQRKGLGRHILQTLLNEMPKTSLFATTGNTGMKNLLMEQGFTITGNSWSPQRGNAPLSLFIRCVS